MKKSTKICLITALVLFILSIGSFAVGAVVGGNPLKTIKEAVKNGGWSGLENVTADFDKDYDVQDFQLVDDVDCQEVEHLEIHVGSGAVTVWETTGDSCRVWVDGDSPKDDVDVSVEDGTLTVRDSTYRKSSSRTVHLWDWIDIRNYTDAVHIIVELPKKVYKGFSCDIQAGAVKLCDMQARKLEVHVDAGCAYGVGTQECGTVELAAEMGSIEFEDILADKCNVNVEMGEIHVQSVQADTLTANVEMGSLVFDRAHAASMEADCEMGDIELKLAGREEDYFISTDNEMGSVNVEGGRKKRYSNAGNEVNLECEMGDIDVSFLNEALAE